MTDNESKQPIKPSRVNRAGATAALIAGTMLSPVATHSATPFSLLPPSERRVNLRVVEDHDGKGVVAHDRASLLAAQIAVSQATTNLMSPSPATVTLQAADFSRDTTLTHGYDSLNWLHDTDVISLSYRPAFDQGSIQEGAQILDNRFGGLMFVSEGNGGQSDSKTDKEPYWPIGMYRFKIGVGQGEYDTNGLPYVKEFSSKSAPSFLYASPFSKKTSGHTANVLRNIDEIMRNFDKQHPLDLVHEPQRKLLFKARDLADAEYDALPKENRPQFSTFYQKHLDAVKERYAKDTAYRGEIDDEVRKEHENSRRKFMEGRKEELEKIRAKGILNERGELEELHGTSFAAPSAAGDAAQLKKQFGLGNKDILTVMCLSTEPVHTIEGSTNKIEHVTTATGRLFDPVRSGWGMVDRQALYLNAARVAEMKRAHDRQDEERTIRSKGALKPEKIGFSEEVEGKYEGIKDGFHVYKLNCNGKGRGLNAQITIDYEKADVEAAGAYITSPSGVRMYIPGTCGNHFPKLPDSTETDGKGYTITRTNYDTPFMQTLINTDAFLGEPAKGCWTIEISDKYTPKAARMTLNSIKHGCYLDRFVEEMTRQPNQSASIDTGMESGSWVSRTSQRPSDNSPSGRVR